MARILISAGERSGDRYAADLVREVDRRRPDTEFAGLGGEELAATGTELWVHAADMTAIGIAEVVGSLPRHYRLLRRFGKALREGRFDLVILVDYPDFNLRLARLARRAGVPVMYYVAPQLWAWRRGRARQLRSDVDRLAVILPFEHDFFARLGVRATFVGHPLLDAAPPPSRTAARLALGIEQGARVVALLPGSRMQEIARHWPLFLATARRVAATGGDIVFLAGAPVAVGKDDPIRVVADSLPSVLAAADAALCKSGTVSLQAALAGLPSVIAYRMNPLSHAVARRLVTVPHIGLGNLIMERRIAPEFIQEAATPVRLARELENLLDPASGAARAQRDGFAPLADLLGRPGAARRAGELALEMLP